MENRGQDGETVKGDFMLSVHTEGLYFSGLSSCDGSECINIKM